MNRILLMSLLAGTLAISACAQKSGTGHTNDDRAQFQTQWMKENLQLTDEQTEKVAILNTKYTRKMDEIKSSWDGKLKRFKAFRDVMKEKEQELKTILTPKQFDCYMEKRQEFRAKTRERAEKYRQQAK